MLDEASHLYKALETAHLDHLNEFFEEYEESSIFMYMVCRHHLEILTLLCKVVKISLTFKEKPEEEGNENDEEQ